MSELEENKITKQPLRKRNHILIAMFALTWVFAAGLFAANFYMDSQQQKKPAKKDAETIANLNSLQGQVVALNKKLEELNSQAEETISLKAQELAEKSAELEQKIGELGGKLEESKNKPEVTDNIIIEAVRLRDNVKNNQPFYENLAMLKLLANGDELLLENIGLIEPYAKTGVKPLDVLQQEFNVISKKIIERSRQDKINPDFIDKTVMRFSSLVTIRKIDAPDGSYSTDDVIARASKKLAAFDIDGVKFELKWLDKSYLAMISDWIKEAEAAKQAQISADAIFRYITSPLYKKSSGKE